MQMCRADNFIGKRLRYSGWLKTENATVGGAHLWFRVDGSTKGAMLQFDNMDGRQVMGTTGWHQYSIVLDVPPDSTALAFGFFVSGTGEAWVSGVKIEEVGLDVPSTNLVGAKDRKMPNAPVNLEFSEARLSDVPFAIGPQRFHDGDAITIQEVQSTSPNLRVGDKVVVRGQYRLSTQGKATLGLYATHAPTEGKEDYSPTQSLVITKGSGDFVLTYQLQYAGELHVTMYDTPLEHPFGGVYFGTASQMQSIMEWTLSDYE